MKLGWLTFSVLALIGLRGLGGCDDDDAARRRAAAEQAWSGHCHDISWLLATTVGSPDRAECPNRRHRMRVQVASAPSHEEFGALVFCECTHDDEGPSDGGQ